MNGFERISRVLNGEMPDRTPVMLHNFMPAAREAGYTMKQYREKPENIARAFIQAALKYDLDGILTDVDTALEAGAMGAVLDFPDDSPARVAGPSGKDIDEILTKLDPKKLQTDERVQIYLEAIRIMKREIGGTVFLRGNADQGPFSLAMMLYGMEEFLADLADEDKKDDILRLIHKCYDVHLEFHLMVSDAGADATSFGDSSCGPDLISRTMYMEFAYPFHAMLSASLREKGIKTICHICGNLDRILQDVAQAGFAGIEADYKTDIRRAAAILKNKAVLFGPIDPSGVFRFGTAADVRQKTREILSLFPDGGLVPGAGCALPPDTSEENIRAFVEEVRSFNI